MEDNLFTCKGFDELEVRELYAIMALRQEVFVVEQDCPYLDADNKDLEAWHIFSGNPTRLTAYTRILPPGISYDDYCSIGRVVTASDVRRSGLGKKIIDFSINKCRELFLGHPIKISAQTYLARFYEGYGFVRKGNTYLEDDIPHIAMVLET